MEFFIYLMRMIMLIFSLKLPGHKQLHPIFVSICGLLQAITVVFKSMKGKKKFYKLTRADIKEPTVGGNPSIQDHPPIKVLPSSPRETTMILSQQEFKKRERALSHLSNNKINHGSGSTAHQGATAGHHIMNIDFESQPLSPAIMREEMKESSDASKINMPGSISPLGDSASDNENV